VFVPHVIVPGKRKGGGKPSPGRVIAAVVAALVGGLVSALSGGAHTHAAHHNGVVLVGMVVGVAFVAGFVVAKALGRQGRG
jgi:hypothetical protein